MNRAHTRTLARALALCAAPVVCLAPARSARADIRPDDRAWDVRIGVDYRFRTDPGYDAFSRDAARAGPVLSLARDIIPLGDHLVLGAELAWRYEGTSSSFAQSFSGSLDSHSLSAGAVLRLTLWSWFQPYARLVGGGTYSAARVDTGSVTPLQGTAWTGFGELGAGILIRTNGAMGTDPWLRTLRLGFQIEGGYLLGSPLDVTLSPRPPSDARTAMDQINVRPLHLGALDTSTPYLRFGAVVRF